MIPSRKHLVKRITRPEREDPKRERNHLRQENRQLKRQVARLQKTNRILEGKAEENEETLATEIENESSVNVISPDSNCPKCGSDNLGSYELPSGKILFGCKACKKYRKSAV